MRGFLMNLLLALAWTAVTGAFGFGGLAAGFGIGYAVLWLCRPLIDDGGYRTLVWRALGFAGFFVRELVTANLHVAYDVVTPRLRARPGIVAVPLDARTDLETAAFANLISLTPGTLSLDVDDRGNLYVHVMFLDDPDALRAGLKAGLERRLLRLLRGGRDDSVS